MKYGILHLGVVLSVFPSGIINVCSQIETRVLSASSRELQKSIPSRKIGEISVGYRKTPEVRPYATTPQYTETE